MFWLKNKRSNSPVRTPHQKLKILSIRDFFSIPDLIILSKLNKIDTTLELILLHKDAYFSHI